MSFCIICSLCRLHWPKKINPVLPQHPLPLEFTKDLADLRKFSLNSLLTLNAVLALSGTKVLLPMVLVLLIYTVSLRFVVNTCFIESYPTLSKVLHIVPLLSASCMAGVELAFDVQSPALTVVLIVLGVLPLITTIVHHGIWHTQRATAVLPIRIQDPPATTSMFRFAYYHQADFTV